MDKTEKRFAAGLLAVGFYLLFTPIFGLGTLIHNREFKTLLFLLPQLWWLKLLLSVLLAVLILYTGYNNINVEARQVGNGQYGTARWATNKEKETAFTKVRFGEEQIPGFVIGYQSGNWLVDTSDASALLCAPPGAGKTKRLMIPSIFYNAMVNKHTDGKGASMILTDCKGELIKKCGTFLKQSGYRVLFLNFEKPLESYQFNLMNNINRHIDRYKAAQTEQDRLLHYGRAERYAKILSSSIVENMGDVQKSDSGDYFNETSKGLLTGMILLVSEYGESEERHIISVFKLIIEMNGLTEDSSQASQKSRLQELLTHIDNERIKNYVGPATSADVRTSMNVFSSALGKLVQFIDAELEPMVCGHSEELNDIDFIKEPTAIFLMCPDSNTTRHFFAALFIRYLMNDLIEQADASPKLTLDRPVLDFWDEFGNMPPIKDFDVLTAAARSRGVRFLLSLQDYGQLEKNYSKTLTKIIRGCIQMLITTYVSPSSREMAEEISKVLGNKTIQSGSVTRGHGYSQSLQMISRPLLTASEIIQLKQGEFIVIKAGTPNAQTKLPMYWDYISDYEDFHQQVKNELKEIAFLTADKIQTLTKRKKYKLTKGQFD